MQDYPGSSLCCIKVNTRLQTLENLKFNMDSRRSVWVKYNLFPSLYSLFPSKNLGWAATQPLVLPGFGIFQQGWERDDNCRLAKQRQAGWETLRMNRTRVWNWHKERPKLGKKPKGWWLWRPGRGFQLCSSAPKPWHGKHDSPVLTTPRKNCGGKLPTCLCHSPAARRTPQ